MKDQLSKRGVTLSVVVVAIVIMLIVISSATVVGTSAISTANFERYQSEIGWVMDDVNVYYMENGKLPVTNESVSFDTLTDEFKSLIAKKGDQNANLRVVNVSLLEDPNIKMGYGDVLSKDIFLVSDTTQNVYYVKGFKYKGVVYYSL